MTLARRAGVERRFAQFGVERDAQRVQPGFVV